ncbi:sugar transferase [Actinobacillus pleuropneumoniae]|uniref:Putative sugar transferase n=3 Tax=Actinobacillus pleuropneumoniae TaxID=715 RepID=A0A0A1H1F1_ACTPL|nr:sugar transferase [Actinobacillus pleuropneumoniae]QSG30267.1 putative sugar transferase [Actinobacillus pleuropneumoniae serovar 19]ABY70045.1 putative sugar transferase [Actinobacillus pleuropneumoniae serovar 3 str. JL03]MBT9319760.1 sugar transferase [Actinobacillus pleuropneumoniae]MBT9344596.1 sugar transferase [Actinobacillus pleuropneumoniae]UKH14978.1 UDP-phosphate galactose phosphotransferase [Actinobacillus pleuropneumoniae]
MNKIIAKISLILVDIVAIFVSILIAVSLRKILGLLFTLPEIDYSYIFFAYVYLILILMMTYLGAYTKRYDFWHESRLIVRGSFLSLLILLSALALGQNAEYYSRSTLVLIFLCCAIVLPIAKIFTKKILFKLGIWQLPAKVISENDQFKNELFEDQYLGYVKAKHSEHKIIFIDGANLGKDRLNQIIEDNIKNSREIIFTPVLNGYDFSHSYIYNIFNTRTNIFTLENELLSKSNRIFKLLMDYILVLGSAVFWVPVLVLIAFWIKKEDPKGEVFFLQRRLGVNGKEFMCYKFRSMYSDQSFMQEWLEKNPEEAAYYRIYHKYINDPRITKIGAFLRKTSLDELPQLINVLRGEMSLVGPRPYMVIEKKDIGKKAPLVLAVKPGITGMWQVSGRSDVNFDSRVEMDVWYMKNWSLWNDIVILIKTVQAVFKCDGAY